MPELPEVEVWRAALARWTEGRRVVAVRVIDPAVVRARLSTHPRDGDAQGAQALEGASGGAAPPLRHGKRLGLRIGEVAFLVHLGMSGRFAKAPEPTRHARLGLQLDTPDAVWFVDPRRFGCVVPVPAAELRARLAEGLGPDALSDPPTAASLQSVLGRRAVKTALMEQSRLAGLGNIHAGEALWRARIHPGRPGHTLDAADRERLADAITAQLGEALRQLQGGELAYVTEGGPNPFAVYGREGEPCPRCGTLVVQARMGGRGTWWCPACQPA